ncbi:MAG TPA: CHAT domain-containing protein, partial [Steroidobacteraceae bacterium]|nr:CHAT domain-containing protein [Steroidobacteraceae bacterium]
MTRDVRIPAGATALIFVRERGVDTTLEIADAAGRIMLRADNPIQRTGLQRAVLSSPTDATFSIRVGVKSQLSAAGQVDLRVVLDRASADDRCQNLQRTLAQADALLGDARRTGQELGDQSASNSSTKAATAAHVYQTAALQAEYFSPSAITAETRLAVASLLSSDELRDWGGAEHWAREAETAYADLNDAYGLARSKAEHAYALLNLAVTPDAWPSGTHPDESAHQTLERARELLNSALQVHESRHERADAAIVLNYIGVSFHNEGQNDAALRAWRRALIIYRQTDDRYREIQLLQNMGVAQYELGRAREANALFNEALKSMDPAEDPLHYSIVLANSALANWRAGRLDQALQEFGRALEINGPISNRIFSSDDLQGLGAVYATLGDRDMALVFFRQALELRPANVDAPARTTTLRAIANILREQGLAQDALRMHEEALALERNSYASSRIRVQIAEDLEALGQLGSAREQLAIALRSLAPDDKLNRALATLEQGQIDLKESKYVSAEAALRSTLATFRTYEAPAAEFEAWVALARSARARGSAKDALESADHALALVEDVRSQSANPELRASLMQSLRSAFEIRISLLAEQYFRPAGNRANPAIAILALQTAEHARMRALSDFQHLDIQGSNIAPVLTQKRTKLFGELASRRVQLEAQLDRSGVSDARVTTLRTEIAGLRQQLDRIDAQIGSSSARASRGRATASLDASLLRSVPASAAIVEYWMGSERAYAWAITGTGVSMVDLGPSAPITRAALAYHSLLRAIGSATAARQQQASADLSRLILEPLPEAAIDRHVLLFAPDGALHYVPFAALRSNAGDGARYLIERHDVAVTSSVSQALESDSRTASTPPRQILLVDDPVYGADDPRLLSQGQSATNVSSSSPLWQRLLRGGDTSQRLPRLPATRYEAAQIAALFPVGSVDQLEGFSARRDRFLALHLQNYRFIHVASHAVTDTEIPQLSALLLSTRDRSGHAIDGRVLAADLLGTKITAEVVVLSACDTAMGRDIAGEGLIGLRYVVLARGAQSVVASLWPVPDRAAAELMASFYASLLHDHTDVVEALSNASRRMLQGEFKDPGVWAAFGVTVRK